jgi:hypothetical protein
LFTLVGCSDFGFHASPDSKYGEGGQPVDTFEPGTVDTADSGEPVDTGFPEHEPETCSVDTMVHMVGSGTQDCPADYAAFMMDDGHGPNFICCPLPATDILVDEPPVDRATTCEKNEVITGFRGQYSYRCTSINGDRYQLGALQDPCYFGSGASGGSGVSGCASHPHTWDVLQQSLFGSDGCSGYPYGSLFVSQTDKYCEDMRTVQVLYNGTVEGDPAAGTPVDMFAD